MGQNEQQVRQLGQQIERLWEQISKKDEQIKDLQQLIVSTQQSLDKLLEHQLAERNRPSNRSRRSSRHSSRKPVYNRSFVNQLIEQNFSIQSPKDLQFCGQGSSFCTYAFRHEQMDKNYIVRCAKHSDSIRRLRWEEQLLPQLGPQMPISIPQFEKISHMDNGLPFCSYPMIEGEPFEEKHYHRLSNPKKDVVIEQLVGFLRVLHSFPVEEAVSFGIPYRQFEAVPIEDIIQFAEKRLYLHLNSDQQERCQYWFDFYRRNLGEFDYQPTLIHGDLQSRHILFNTNTNLIEGIIDFEDIRISDAREDLYHLQDSYGDDFGQRLFQAYGIDKSNFSHQFQFRRLTDIISEVFIALLDKRDRETKHRLRELREFLLQPLPDLKNIPTGT